MSFFGAPHGAAEEAVLLLLQTVRQLLLGERAHKKGCPIVCEA